MSKDEEDEAPSRRGPLLALVAIAVLVACGLWLNDILSAVSHIQDCVMSGRTNCAPIIPGGK